MEILVFTSLVCYNMIRVKFKFDKWRYVTIALILMILQPITALMFVIVPYLPDFKKLEQKSPTGEPSYGIWRLKEGVMNQKALQRLGLEYKQLINGTPKAIFDKLKFFGVPVPERDRQEPSRGIDKMRLMWRHFMENGINMQGSFVDLCAGSGGWSYFFDRIGMKGVAISFWKMHPQHAQWTGPESVTRIQADIGKVDPIKADWIFCDGGEGDFNYDKEEQRHANLLSKVLKWLEHNPNSNFAIKVLAPTGRKVLEVLKMMQDVTGKGQLIRLEISRLSTSEMYFVSLPRKDLEQSAYACLRELLVKWKTAMRNPPERVVFRLKEKGPQWMDMHEFKDIDNLAPFDYEDSINHFMRNHTRQEPRNLTGFLKEVCYFYSLGKGSQSSRESSLILQFLAPIMNSISGLSSWKSTSTTPAATFRMVLEKVDKEPLEQHPHWDLIKGAYDVMADYLVERGRRLTMQSEDQVYHAANPQGTMSQQEASFVHQGVEYQFPNIKDYAGKKIGKKYLWTERMNTIMESFENGRPKLAIFETTGKKEKKQDFSRLKDKGSRLIWFLPATLRLFEQMIFGGLENILENIPFTVCGRPLYDYGEMLAQIFTTNTEAVADDIAGWDTRISKGIQVLECDLLKKLAKTSEHRKYITWLYRIYANACVAIDRHIPGEPEPETALYYLRGQVASGRRPTYAMNTLTNLILTLVSAGKARGLTDIEILAWMKRKLRQGQSEDFSALVSGDDKVVIMQREKLRKFATEAYKFMNEIGLIRKDMALNEPSRIITRLEDVEFCSNNYVEVKYHLDTGMFKRWMPIRGVHEIFGKAKITLSRAKDDMTEKAWSKTQGLNLLMNYHHIPEVRALALSILSSVDSRVSLEGLAKGWTYQARPWIRDGDALEIINNCLFGESTTIPRCRYAGKMLTLRDAGQVSQEVRAQYCRINTHKRRAWYKHLAFTIQQERETFHRYENWYEHMTPLRSNYPNYD